MADKEAAWQSAHWAPKRVVPTQEITFRIPTNDLLELATRVGVHGPDLEIAPDQVVKSACTLIDRLIGR